MSCVNSSCCDCQGSCQPVSSSQPAICAANCATVGTGDTINSLITNGSQTLTAVLAGKQKQQQLAVKAQTQIAQSQIHAVALVAIAVIAILGFLFFGRMRT
jgi:hypothetical protein